MARRSLTWQCLQSQELYEMRLSLILLGILTSFPVFSKSLIAIDDPQALALLVQSVAQADHPAIRVSLMRGMLSGLAGRREVPVPEHWKSIAANLAESGNKEVRELSMRLSQIFGDADATHHSLRTLQNPQADLADRRTALDALLTQQNSKVSPLLESLLDDPDLRRDAIRGYAVIENEKAPDILLRRYAHSKSSEQKAIIETLATRKLYASVLLQAIQNKTIDRDSIPTHVIRSLANLGGDLFHEVFGDVRRLGEDREKLMAKYKSLLTPEAIAQGNPSRGRLVFVKTCGACHTLYGTGGEVGPDLTGSNRANLDYLLLNSIDPSFDVPEGYKMVMIQTVDGRLVSGVIAEEDGRRVVIRTVAQPSVVILKSDIEARKLSSKSMMPEGQLDQMKLSQVIDLIKYLQTTQQVEMPE